MRLRQGVIHRIPCSQQKNGRSTVRPGLTYRIFISLSGSFSGIIIYLRMYPPLTNKAYMFAREIMTTKVITVTPDTPVRDIAHLLVDNGISALPVVNARGEIVGMVSEGDLIGRSAEQRVARKDWWLSLWAGDETLTTESLASLQSHSRKAQDIMSSPVITVSETTEIADIAHLLTEYHIKRVPVVHDNRIAGIVSRADLVRALCHPATLLATEHQPKEEPNFLSQAFIALNKNFHMNSTPAPGAQQEKTDILPASPDSSFTAKNFQTLAADFEHAKMLEQEKAHEKTAGRSKQVAELFNHHIDDAAWQALLQRALEAARQGKREWMILRFPNALCSDGGRAINVGESGWPETLQGEAAEICLRWKQDLKPQGFHMSARTLEYPGGFPGDIGLFLLWG